MLNLGTYNLKKIGDRSQYHHIIYTTILSTIKYPYSPLTISKFLKLLTDKVVFHYVILSPLIIFILFPPLPNGQLN